ncbi:MAG: TolC family protein [Kiritimatiellia bacterium]
MMVRRMRLAVFGLLALAAGCGTVKEAREAQERLADKGAADAGANRLAPAVDLKGVPLRALVEFALTNRPSMVAAAIDVRDARLALKQVAADAPIASTTPWNAVDASASFGYSETSPQKHFDDLGHTRKGTAAGGVSLELLVYDFGRNKAQTRAKAEQVVAAELALVKEGYSVFDEVACGYFTWLRNAALLEVACTNELEFIAHLRQAEERLAVGEVREMDVLRARVDLAQARQAIVAASNEVVTAGADLMAAMGVEVASGDAGHVLGPGSGGFARVLRALPETTEDARQAFSLASTNAPAMKIARAKLRAASAEVDYAVADLMPSVSASLSLRWADPLWYWSWGVEALQSLFTGFKKTTAVDRAVLAMESAAASVDREAQQLSSDLSLAIAERDNAREALCTAQTSVREAQKNLETVKAEYRVGEASTVDLTDAVSNLTTAYGDRIKAYYRGQIAEAQLFQLTGRDPVYPQEAWIAEE